MIYTNDGWHIPSATRHLSNTNLSLISKRIRECWISVRSVIDGRIKLRPNTTYNKLVHNTLRE